jgi:hypothetical protein
MPVRIIFYRKAFVISELRCVAVTAVTAVAERSRSQPKSAEVSRSQRRGIKRSAKYVFLRNFFFWSKRERDFWKRT